MGWAPSAHGIDTWISRRFARIGDRLVTIGPALQRIVDGMKLPSADRAIVAPEKIHDYLLSPSHPVGSEKARVFEAVGYRRAAWRRLQRDLYSHAQHDGAELMSETAHGRKYRIRAILRGPRGSLPLTTIWIVPRGEDVPRFVTAYPTTP